jgi:hypothetical protein
MVAALDVGEPVFDRLKQSRSLLEIEGVVDPQKFDFR